MPVDPSEDELARNWSLTPADLAAIAACRGADQRRRFALQLCMLRKHGRFLDDYRHAPIKIVNHLSRQLGLPPVLFLDRSGREPAELEPDARGSGRDRRVPRRRSAPPLCPAALHAAQARPLP